MWVSRKEWEGVKKRTIDIEKYIQNQWSDIGVREFSLYADNEIYLKELRICVSYHDWCLLKSQPCFLELMRFVHSLQTQESKGSLV